MKTFADLGLAEPLLRAVAAEGYTHPTPIQAQVIPEMLAGHDVIGIAQTGTGKTASFVLPILHQLAAQKLGMQKIAGPGPRAVTTLILAPTRELAQQISDSIRTYGKFMRPRITLVVGGANPVPQIKSLAAGSDIVVATPGRLLDHMRAGKVRLDRTTEIVLDEADQMLDMGFIPAVEEIMLKVSAQRQVLLLSATMPKPIRALAQNFMSSPKEIAIAAISKPAEKIQQEVIMVQQGDKNDMLIDILAQQDVERAIVFTRTKRGTDKVERLLNDAGLKSVGLHGDKSQGQRNRALAQFKSGSRKILVATDVAARGLDVDEVSHVVNFDIPTIAESYVHRIGRTGRAGRSGIAISLCDKSERGLLRDIERLIHSTLSPMTSSESVPMRKDHFIFAALPPGSQPSRRQHDGQPSRSGKPNSRPNNSRPHKNRPFKARTSKASPSKGRGAPRAAK